MWKHFNIENLKLPITPLLYTKFFNSQALNIHSPKLIAMKVLESSSYRKCILTNRVTCATIIAPVATFSLARVSK